MSNSFSVWSLSRLPHKAALTVCAFVFDGNVDLGLCLLPHTERSSMQKDGHRIPFRVHHQPGPSHAPMWHTNEAESDREQWSAYQESFYHPVVHSTLHPAPPSWLEVDQLTLYFNKRNTWCIYSLPEASCITFWDLRHLITEAEVTNRRHIVFEHRVSFFFEGHGTHKCLT